MDKYFNHKCIFYALSILVAVVAAYESIRLLLLWMPYCVFLYYKRFVWKEILLNVCVAICFFAFAYWQKEQLEQPLSLEQPFTWMSEYKIDGNRLRGFLKAENGTKIYATYEIKSEEEKNLLMNHSLAGIVVMLEGGIIEPSLPAHRFSFSMKNYLKSKGAVGIVEIKEIYQIETKKSIASTLAKQRFQIKQHIERTFPKSLVAEAQALLIGLQENVDEDVSRAYQKLGITHLFAISGLHVALLSLLFFQGLIRLRVRRELATVILLIILPMYALLAGGAPSVWRAVAVVEVVLLVKYFKVRLPIDDALALSFIAFIAFQPYALFQVGFQLSYLATASLIYSSYILAKYQNMWIQSFFMTVVCQLLVYPLLLIHFYEISLSSFLANVVFVPLFSFIILPINVVLLFITKLSMPLAHLLFILYEPFRTFLTQIIMWLQSLPYQMWTPGKPSLLWVIFLYVSVFLALYLLDLQKKWWRTLLVVIMPALLFQSVQSYQSNVEITFINVGQGDCILIELPKWGGNYLIDTGGILRFNQEIWKRKSSEYEVGTQIVVPFLKGKGITSLEALILTHADADHVEGAEEILQEIRVNEIHITPNSAYKEAMEDLLVVAKKYYVPILEKMQGTEWKQGNVKFRYLWPTETSYEGNNDSLVLLMEQGNWRALFTGDLEEQGEEQLVKQYGPILRQLNLLKAGHHGSKTSSSELFIAHTMPSLTVFMAGENNRYGHPHKEVIQRLDDNRLCYLSTADHGTIAIRLKNEAMIVHTQQ